MARALAALCTLLVALVATLVPLAPGAAQEESIAADLDLQGQPVWHGPKDRLDLKLRVTNVGSVPLEGFVIQVYAYSRLTSRFELHESFDGADTVLTAGLPKRFDERDVKPGKSAIVRIRDRLTTLPLFDRNGVYPVAVVLFDVSGLRQLDTFTTEVIYYASREGPPLGLSLVVPLNATPFRDPDGVFRASTSQPSLMEAVRPGGWLRALAEGIANRGGDKLRLSIAPSPRLMEELADLADGYRVAAQDGEVMQVGTASSAARGAAEVLAHIKSALRTEGIQPLLMPYSFVDLPTLTARLHVDQLLTQLSEARKALQDSVGVEPAGDWIFAPAGRMDVTTVDRLKTTGMAHTFFSHDSLQQPEDPFQAGCPMPTLSFTCPVVVKTIEGDTIGYQSDSGLEDRFSQVARGDSTRLDLQRLFAETAMIREELPSEPGRIVQVTVPSLWHPSPRFSNLLLRAIQRAPWLETVTATEGLTYGVDPVKRQVVESLPQLKNVPPDDYFDAIGRARYRIATLHQLQPPTELTERLRRNVLAAQARMWWTAPELVLEGQSYATHTGSIVDRELSKLSLGTQGNVTLTSRRGTLQLSVFNDTGYPVSLRVVLSSQKLQFSRSVFVRRFQPGTTALAVDVTAQSSGIFPVDVRLATPRDRRPLAHAASISVRSTEFNEIALGVTIGALAFLVLFYVWRGLRRRKKPGSDEAAEALST